jgi:HSP20 family protein
MTKQEQQIDMIRATRTFSPPTDVIELADKILVVVEVAGIQTHALEITLLDRQMVIQGTRTQPEHPNPAYHQVEIGYGVFRTEVGLPWAIERERVSASYEAGFLTIELPRKAARTILVQDAQQNGE